MKGCGWSLCHVRLLFPSERVTFKLNEKRSCTLDNGPEGFTGCTLDLFTLPDELGATVNYLIEIWQMRMHLPMLLLWTLIVIYFSSFVWLFFKSFSGQIRGSVFLRRQAATPICCLCTHTCTFGSCFPSSLPLSLRPSLGIRDNLIYQETQSGPPWPSVSPSLG